MTVPVTPSLHRQKIDCIPGNKKSRARIENICIVYRRCRHTSGICDYLFHGKSILQPVIQVVLSGQQHCLRQASHKILRGKCRHLLIPGTSGKQKFPCAAPARHRRTVRKIHIVFILYMHIHKISRNIAHLSLQIQTGKMAVSDRIQNLQRIEKAQSGMTVVQRSLVTASVLSILRQKIIDAAAGLFGHAAPEILLRLRKENGQQDILCTPDCPVIHRLFSVPHPPEMSGKIWLKNPRLQFVPDPFADNGIKTVKLLSDQVTDCGQNGCRLAGEQVEYRFLCIRQRQLRRIPSIRIMRRQLPAAFLADAEDPVDDIRQELACI